MFKRITPYWWCQIGGWSAYILMYTFFYFTIRLRPNPNFFSILLLDAVLGFLVTHTMRWIIIKTGLLEKNIRYRFYT